MDRACQLLLRLKKAVAFIIFVLVYMQDWLITAQPGFSTYLKHHFLKTILHTSAIDFSNTDYHFVSQL